MATQETSVRDQEDAALPPAPARSPQISLVVDRPSPVARGMLVLPAAAPENEAALGRHVGLLLQRRLQPIADYTVGHGLLIAAIPGTRRYLPLIRPLSAEQALSCAGSWGAEAVLSGSITLQPRLRWEIVLREVPGGRVLFEDTLEGAAEELLDAPGYVARALAEALDLPLDAGQLAAIGQREAKQVEALLAYLQAVDLRPQHQLTQIAPDGVRRHLLRALRWDPSFAAPASMLIADMLAATVVDTFLEHLVSVMAEMGEEGAAGAAVLARTLEERGYPEQATWLVIAILDQDPGQPLALDLAAHHAYRAGHFARARTLVQALLDVQPDHAAGRELLGNLLAAVGRFPGAAQQWELALELDPPRPRLLMRLGAYLAVAGEHDRAYTLLRRATAAGASTADSLYQLGTVAYRLGLNAEGIAALHLALQRDPDRGNAHAMLARCYTRAGRPDLALVHDGRAMELLPNHWPSALAVAHAVLTRGQAAEALDAYTQVAWARPDLAEALYGLGTALVARNMIDDGLVVLHRARELQGNDPGILSALAMTYIRAGKLDSAEQIVSEAVAIAPDSQIVARCIDTLRRYRPRWRPGSGR